MDRDSLLYVHEEGEMFICIVTPNGSRQCLATLMQFSLSLFLLRLSLLESQAVVILAMLLICI